MWEGPCPPQHIYFQEKNQDYTWCFKSTHGEWGTIHSYQCTLGWQGSERQICKSTSPSLWLHSTPKEKNSWHVKNDVSSDSPWTNAGMGSNLTVSETVECDAFIMDGHITVWCCWSCARCEESYPCSQKFTMNIMTWCERELSLSSTGLPGE